MSQNSPNGKQDSAQGITRITVQGFKSLYEECSIEIRPLTILAGANSSGKSSIMQPLLLMKQTLEAPYDPGALLLNGPNVQFTFVGQFLSQLSKTDSADQFTVKIEADRYFSIRNTFRKTPGKDLEIVETVIQKDERELTFTPETSTTDLIKLIPEIDENERSFLFSFLEKEPNFEEAECKIERERCFLNFNCQYHQKSHKDPSRSMSISLYNSGEQTNLLESYIQELIHVPGLRNNPDRAYKVTAIGSKLFSLPFKFPGRFEDYVASVISYWKTDSDHRFLKLKGYLQDLRLAKWLDVKQINDVQIELQVSRSFEQHDISQMVNIADVGLGVSQVLPVLVALLIAESDQVVYVEQPEIHLHPRAQVALAQVLADAAKRGVRVVVETHSELLILGVQALVAEGKLSPDVVKLHWFTRREDGVTEVNSADLDETGAFGEWAEDFSDVSLRLENRYLSAAEARLWKQANGG